MGSKRFKVNDLIEGEYEILHIKYIGKSCAFCEVIARDDKYESSYPDVGDELTKDIHFLERRYGITTQIDRSIYRTEPLED